MSENRNITVSPYPNNNACFMGVGVAQPCSSCHAGTEKSLYRILIKDKDGVHDDNSFILCSDCLKELDEQIRHELNFTVNLNDTVWELTRCDDGKWHVFP